ncbi:MAG: heparinase II/III family protein [Pseudomonadota bacterium]
MAAPSRKPPGAFSKLLSAANDEWRATPFYRLTLGGADPDRIAQWGKDPRAGDPRRGEEILRGRWRIGAERLSANYRIPWSAAPPSLHFAARLHSFCWLGDVAAVGGAAGAAIADYIATWNEGFGDWHAEAWAPELTAERLFAWLCHGREAFEGGDPTMRPALMRSFGRQARHLAVAATDLSYPPARIKAGAALTLCGCTGIPDGERLLDAGVELLEEACASQFLSDGGHLSRAPEILAEALCDLIAADNALVRHAIESPKLLRDAMPKMAAMLRFLSLGDGALACFNGGGECNAATVNRAVAEFEGEMRRFTVAPQSGYHRLAAKDLALVMDCAAAPPPLYGDRAHAGALSFELSSGLDRMIVNVGSQLELDPQWRAAGRATNGHSTLVVDDALSAEFERVGRGAARPRGPAQVTAKRADDDDGARIEASHDGYRADYGLIHRRTIYIDKSGADLRGVDSLSRPMAEKKSAAPHRAPFAIRFHLHPEVNARLGEAGAALIDCPGTGGSWRLKTDAARMHFEDSVYLGAPDGPQRTRQIVLSGAADPNGTGDGPPNRVRWAFTRVDRA